MQEFNVRYHDGKISLAHEARLTLMPGHWLIQYADELGELHFEEWDVSRIAADHSFASLYIFRYGAFPEQTIESKDDNLLAELRKVYPDSRLHRRSNPGSAGKTVLIMATLAVIVIGLLAAAYYYLLPFLAEKAAAGIPQTMEMSLGDTVYEKVAAGYTVDDTLTKRVNAFANAIDFKTSYPIQITVVKESQLNAFALPGGHIIVFDGILKEMKSKEELAALLAHEVSHVHYRHSLKSMFRSLGSYLFLSLILNDISGIAAVLAENSNMLLNLTYSRSLETEADEKAMQTLECQGISLKGFVALFTTMEKQENGSPGTSLLSTHPLTKERIARASALAREQTNFRDQAELQKRWEELDIH